MSVNDMIRMLAKKQNLKAIESESVMVGNKRTPSKTALRLMSKYFRQPKGTKSDISVLISHYTNFQKPDKEALNVLPLLKKVLNSMLFHSPSKVNSLANSMTFFNKALGSEFQNKSKLILKKTQSEVKASVEISKKALDKSTNNQIVVPISKVEKIIRELANDLANTNSIETRSKALLLIEISTGVRHIGTLGQIKWSKAGEYKDGTDIILQKGRRKDSKSEDSFDKDYEVAKPLILITFAQLQRAVAVVKRHVDDWFSHNENIKDPYLTISKTWLSTTNLLIKSLFLGIKSEDGREMTSHKLRAFYSTFAITHHPIKSIGRTKTINAWLGQSLNSSVATHYETIQLVGKKSPLPASKPIVTPVDSKNVMVKGKPVMKNPKVRGSALANAKISQQQYILATGKNPTQYFMRKNLGYGAGIIKQL
jgi:hypothetical protein